MRFESKMSSTISWVDWTLAFLRCESVETESQLSTHLDTLGLVDYFFDLLGKEL